MREKRMYEITEADRAAQLLGEAIVAEQIARDAGELLPHPIEYRIRCHFCHHIHVSPYWDVIDEEIMAHRDAAPAWRQARLADWQPLEIIQTEWMPESQV